MARGIHDIGNGFGYVYMTDLAGTTIQSVVPNTIDGARLFKQNGNNVAPFAANRSAYGIITFTTGVAGLGSITGVAVNGVDQIGGSILVTGFTDDQCAEAVANAMNGFTPGSGYDYFAVAIGASVYIYAPPSAGATPNGYGILVSDSGGVVTYTSQSFSNGGNAQGVYDSVMGSRFFLNADYGPNGISGELAASPDSLTNAIEITKFFVSRGQQVGIFNKDVTANSYALAGVDRSGMITKINVTPQTGNTQTLIKINPENFVDGDIVFIQAAAQTDTITVESAPAITVPGTGNIYLTDDYPWVSNRYTGLMLQYKYINGLGPVFTEVARSISENLVKDDLVGATIFVNTSGNDGTAQRGNFSKQFATVDAALAVAQAGDLIYIYPGTYNVTNPAGLCVVHDLQIHCTKGVTLTGNLFNGFNYVNFRITGNGYLIPDDSVNAEISFDMPLGTGESFDQYVISCDVLQLEARAVCTTGGNITFNINEFLVVPSYWNSQVGLEFNGTNAASASTLININTRLLVCSPRGNTSALGSYSPITFDKLPAASVVKLKFSQLLTRDQWSPGIIEVIGNAGVMDFRVEVNGDMICNTGAINSYFLIARDNRDWDTTTVTPSGFYYNGTIYAEGSVRKAAKLLSGKLLNSGKTRLVNHDNYGYLLDNGASALASHLLLHDIDAQIIKSGVANTVLVYYATNNHIAQMKNISANAPDNLIDSANPGQTYYLLSGYSNVAAAANVTNGIAGTTLVVDANIIPS